MMMMMITSYLHSANLQKNASELHAAMCTADRNCTPLGLQENTTAFVNLSTTSSKTKARHTKVTPRSAVLCFKQN